MFFDILMAFFSTKIFCYYHFVILLITSLTTSLWMSGNNPLHLLFIPKFHQMYCIVFCLKKSRVLREIASSLTLQQSSLDKTQGVRGRNSVNTI